MKTCKCCKQPIKTDSKYLWLFDNGHGGIIDGVVSDGREAFANMVRRHSVI